jgi:hypothetical protein
VRPHWLGVPQLRLQRLRDVHTQHPSLESDFSIESQEHREEKDRSSEIKVLRAGEASDIIHFFKLTKSTTPCCHRY